MSPKLILLNPRSANAKHRIPNSILQVGASIEGKYEYVFVDGNREADPLAAICQHLESGGFAYLGMSVMPGPQLQQAIPIAAYVRQHFPEVVQVWGGYFASNQHKAVLGSGYVDFVIDGPGDTAFPKLLAKIEEVFEQTGSRKIQDKSDFGQIENLIFLTEAGIHKPQRALIPDYDSLPPLPYEQLNRFYSLEGYLPRTFLGKRTFAYHSSFGCPFTCSFCGIVPIYEARWKAKSAAKIFEDVRWMKENYGADAVEFHDNNFFVAEKRTVEFARLMLGQGMNWWGEARIDTMDKYKDESLAVIRESGCKMIFFGAETGNDEVLKQIDKGGTQTGEQILRFAERMKRFDIIPEYSFVLGFPAPTAEAVMRQIEADIAFIKQIKEINPQTEIIIYVYSPVPTEGSELFEQVKAKGFAFPEKLEDWLDPVWEKFDLRKNPLTPWLTAEMIDKIKNFETVLNAYYPTVSDIQLSPSKRNWLKRLGKVRYEHSLYRFPYEIKLLHKLWRYRQPEIEGF